MSSCGTCRYWRAPAREPETGKGKAKGRGRSRGALGYCKIDRCPSHSGYFCWKYASSEVTAQSVGLRAEEVLWIRAHPRHSTVRPVIEAYRKVERAPHNPEARYLFDTALAEWRSELARQGIALRRLSDTPR